MLNIRLKIVILQVDIEKGDKYNTSPSTMTPSFRILLERRLTHVLIRSFDTCIHDKYNIISFCPGIYLKSRVEGVPQAETVDPLSRSFHAKCKVIVTQSKRFGIRTFAIAIQFRETHRRNYTSLHRLFFPPLSLSWFSVNSILVVSV